MFAVGAGGTYVPLEADHRDPGTVADMQWISAIWGSGPTNASAVGRGGTLLHDAGKAWTPMDSGTVNDPTAVWGTSSNDVFAVGIFGTNHRHRGPRPQR